MPEESSEQFKLKTRLAALDQAKSNNRAEKWLCASRGSPWARLALNCEIHQVAGISKTVFSMVEGTIEGQVNLSLALNHSTGMSVFAKLLRDHVMAKIVILRGAPSKEAECVRRQLMTLALSRGTRLVERRVSMRVLPNGDWRRRDRIEVWLPIGASCDELRVEEAVT